MTISAPVSSWYQYCLPLSDNGTRMTDFSGFHSNLLQERPANWSGMGWVWGFFPWPGGGCATDKIAVRDRRSNSEDDQNMTVILRLDVSVSSASCDVLRWNRHWGTVSGLEVVASGSTQ